MFGFFKNKKKQSKTKSHYVVVQPKNYAAAKTNNMTYSWTNYKYTSDQIIDKYMEALVAKSCEQCMNNPYARKYLLLLANNVIGDTGIKPQGQAKDANGKLDVSANQALESAWADWSKNCDVTGKLNLVSLFKLLIQTNAREGEGLVRIVTGKDAGEWGFALQLIDPRRLDIKKNEILPNGNYIRFGIEFNKYGKPLYYHLKKYSDEWRNVVSTGVHEKIPADEIIHGFISEYIDQKRGLPWFSTVLMRMYMLGGFEEAAVEHARAGACQMGFITTPNDLDDEDDGKTSKDYDMDIEATPATFKELPPGYDIKKFDPNYPNGEFDSFNKAILRGISAGLGPSYNTLACDLTSVNFSSLRQGILDEREHWKGLQEWFISTYVSPIFDKWLKYSLLASKIKCNGGCLKPDRLEKYKNVSWTVRRWSWVDPVKDINSASISVQNGFRSRSDVIRELGHDPDDVWEEIEKENELLKAKNILVKDEVIRDVREEE